MDLYSLLKQIKCRTLNKERKVFSSIYKKNKFYYLIITYICMSHCCLFEVLKVYTLKLAYSMQNKHTVNKTIIPVSAYSNASVCLYSTQNSLFRVSQGLQLLLHLLDHHRERSFGMSCQVPSSKLQHGGSQTFGVLLCQNRRDTQNSACLRERTKNVKKRRLRCWSLFSWRV